MLSDGNLNPREAGFRRRQKCYGLIMCVGQVGIVPLDVEIGEAALPALSR
jgi:hypothetical protein